MDNNWEPPRPAPPPPPTTGDPTAQYPTTGTPPLQPTVEAVVERPNRRPTATIIAAVVGVVALLGAGVFAVSRIASSDDGGADSPEAAGEALLAAVESEDALGAIDVLLPGERDALRDPLTALVDELRRIEVLSDDADLNAVGGVDIQIDDESVQADATNVEDIVNLQLTGRVSASVDGEALPIGDLLLDNEADPSDLTTETREPEDLDLPMTAVQRDGRWYLSLGYTVAELARGEMEDQPDIPAEGIPAIGGDSPEDAMDNMIDGIEALDLQGIIGSLDPQEFGALQRYAPLFLDEAQAELDGSAGSVTIDDPEYSVSGGGDTRFIGIDYLRMAIDVEDDPGTITLEDGCWKVEARDDVLDTCQLGEDLTDLEDVFGEGAQAARDLIEAFRTAFDDYENPGFVVKRVDGQWFVSPVATVAEQLLAVLEAIDREEIDDLISAVEDAAEGDLEIDTEELVPVEDLIDDYSNPNDASAPTTVSGDLPIDGSACEVETDGDDAAACFKALIDAGDIDPAEVPPYLRVPECGLADLFWSGDYFGLPDAEFVTVVEEAAPCFQAAVEDGTLSPNDLPLELDAPECLDGRNWYTTEDQTYDDDFMECASN